MGNFIPNSYQTPNDYADQFLHLLSGEEWKVLSYTIRRIFGFQKRQDNISLSQYQWGKRDEEGEFLDHGTGLSRGTLVRVLRELVRYGLLLRVAEGDSAEEGDCYALQLDARRVDSGGLERRAASARESNAARTRAARDARTKGRSVGQTGPSPLPGLSDRPPTRSVSQTAPSLSHRPRLVCPTDHPRSVGQTDNNKKENQEKHTHPLTTVGDGGEGVCVSEAATPEPGVSRVTGVEAETAGGGGSQRGGVSPVTHPAEPAAERRDRRPPCGCTTPHRSRFCDEERIRIAANISTIRSAEGYAMASEVRGGRDDAILLKRLREMERPGAAANVSERDPSACPDCRGTGMYYPEGPERGVAKCKHPRLEPAAAR